MQRHSSPAVEKMSHTLRGNQRRADGGFWVAPCPSGTSFIALNSTSVWKKPQGSGLLAAARKSQRYLNVHWGAGEERKIKKDNQSPPAAPLASKVFTKSPRLGYSILCCVHREQVISKTNQKCIHYRRAAVGESDCSFHWQVVSALAQSNLRDSLAKPLHPPAFRLSPHHPSWLCQAQPRFSVKGNLIQTLDDVFPSITTTLLCKSCFLPNKSSEYF